MPSSLKQRLATLSLATTSPTLPRRDSSSLFEGKRKLFFGGPTWTRRCNDQAQEQEVEETIHRLIYQAGVDYETRPMVILSASALPDPSEVSYDVLLSRVLAYLNLYVESDYTVVFFAAGGKHTPGWNWIWKAYRSLNRKYRKNLKQLYIVHSSFFSRMLFSLAGAIISPKFFRKVEYIPTLSELAFYVPLTQIDIPLAVYQENMKHEQKINLPILTRANIFGVPLEELMGYEGEKGGVPRVVKDCIQFLRETGLEEEGLFRRSPSSTFLKSAKEAYDRGHVISLETFGDPHLAAVLLKKYLRDLPEPLFPESLYSVIRRCPLPSDDVDMTSVLYIRETLLPQLVPCAYILLNHVLQLLHEVALRSEKNLMDAHNLAIVISPNLVSGTNPARDVTMCIIPGGPTLHPSVAGNDTSTDGKATLGAVIKICIQRYYEVFDEIRDRSEAVPPQRTASIPASESSQSTPHSHHEDEEVDDAMLVMPIGPSLHSHRNQIPESSSSPPSSWSSGLGAGLTYKPRSQRKPVASGVRSIHTVRGEVDNSVTVGSSYSTIGKARSMISIENGTPTHGRKGSIAVGRGTTRKSSGAGVEAISITAEGFFAPHSSAPPVPSITGNTS